MSRLLVAFLLAFAACGPPEATRVNEAQQPIVNGSEDPDGGDPTVGALWILGANGVDNFCTGISIGPQTFATSAHCFENAEGGTIFVVFTPSAFEALDGGHRVEVDDFQVDPGYKGNTNDTLTEERDLALAHLKEPSAGPFVALNRYPVDRLGLWGKPVRLVGYGRLDTVDNAAGPKQETTKLDYRVATSTELLAGADGGLACRGDSGGPAFFATPSGEQAIVSIDSRGDAACEELDISTRVDAELAFIQSFMQAHGDSPDCGADGRCGFNCAAPDPDCPCAPDGFCTSACAQPELDPDCPQSCLFDGGLCGPPDPPVDTGCGCGARGDASGLSFVALAVVLTRARRRRRAC